MITKKPSIFIYVRNPDERMLKEICAGIEEEGVFYEIREVDAQSLDELAWQAANDSMPGSGIGILGSQAALQLRGLDKGQNVAVLQGFGTLQSQVTAAPTDFSALQNHITDAPTDFGSPLSQVTAAPQNHFSSMRFHEEAVLQYSDLARCRILGSNSARAVKKMAFK